MNTKHGVRMVVTGLALAVSLGVAGQAAAATLYVDASNTSGTEDGTAVRPFSTIQAAVDAAVNRDLIRVAAGVYYGDVSITTKGLRLIGEDPTRTTIRGTSRVVAVSNSDPSTVVEVAGFTLTGGSASGFSVNNNNVAAVIHNCIIAANRRGIETWGRGTVNAFNDVIVGSSDAGVFANANSQATVTSSLILNNGTGVYTTGDYYNQGAVISSSYNVYFGNGADSGSHYSTVNSANDLTADPLVVAPDTGDYRLQAGSPAINAGSPITADRDPDGTRNDIGVYGGPGAAPFWPLATGAPVVTSLTVTPHDVPLGGTLRIQATGRAQ